MSCIWRDVANGGFRVLGAIAVMAFLALLLNLGVDVYFARVSKDWPCTLGTITENTVNRTTHQDYENEAEGVSAIITRRPLSKCSFNYHYAVD